MLSSLVLHPLTRDYLRVLIEHPRQAVLFVGESGMGKHTILHTLCAEYEARPENILLIDPMPSESIGIEEIRSIRQFIQLKSNAKDTKRFIVINNAQTLTDEAQNALLKSLEEPPENVYFMLSATSRHYFLPTILSRLETHDIKRPSKDDITLYLATLKPSEDVSKINAMSAGLPGLAVSLAKGESNDFLVTIDAAKEFMSASPKDRLVAIELYIKDRQKLVAFLDACTTICRATLDSLVALKKPTGAWEEKTKSLLRANELVTKNVSSKLVMTELALSL